MAALSMVSGCSIGPNVRLADEQARPASIAEGRQLLEDGRAVEAVAAFRQLLRERGADLQALNGLAIAYSELGRSDLATEMFARALALAPDDAGTLNNVGFSALRRADATLARHYLTKARARNGDLEEIDGNLARLALLETIGSPSAPAFVAEEVTVIAKDGRPPTALRSTTSTVDRSTASSDTDAETAIHPTTTMIDFTTVMDPFAGVSANP